MNVYCMICARIAQHCSHYTCPSSSHTTQLLGFKRRARASLRRMLLRRIRSAVSLRPGPDHKFVAGFITRHSSTTQSREITISLPVNKLKLRRGKLERHGCLSMKDLCCIPDRDASIQADGPVTILINSQLRQTPQVLVSIVASSHATQIRWLETIVGHLLL